MKFGQVHHIEYYVNDLNKSNVFWDWFMTILEYKKIAQWDDGVSWEHSSGTYIVFVQTEEKYLSVDNNRRGNGLNHIAFMGNGLEELDALESQLKARGIEILKRDGGYLCFEDPNKFAVEVYAD